MIDLAPAECCTPIAASTMSSADAEVTSRVFKALADPSRVRIVNLLVNAGEPVCVCDLTPQLGLSQPTVSFHLKKLVDAGLLRREQRGTWAFYSVEDTALDRLSTVFRLEGARA
jgi:ArsR family transcriptional regulator